MDTPDLLPSPSHVIGPTWQKLRSGGFWLPEPNRTLGDQVIEWMNQYLMIPGGERAGEPFEPTDEQGRFLMWWYAIDEHGKFVYRNGVLRRCKGWGKDPLLAAIALADLCGPVVFSHFDENGMPVGKPHHQAWVQVAAVSQSQTKNTFRMFPALASKKLRAEYKLDINQTVIHATLTGGLIEGVTSSPSSLEGNRPTLVILNEIQEWVESNQGTEMFGVIEGNVAKIQNARWLAICNAHRPGEESIGERLWKHYQDVQGGVAIDTGLLYDAIEAPADTPISEIPPQSVDPEGFEAGVQKLREGLKIAAGDAHWLPIDDYIASILNRQNPVTESRRKYLNQINASEDSWIAPHEWDACQADVKLEPGDRIGLAFDGSKSGDWAALVACRIEDGAIFLIKAWNPKNYGGEIPREDVDATVHWVFSKYTVVGFRADVRMWESYVDAWAAKYGRKLKYKVSSKHPIAFDMRGESSSVRKQFALDCERFLAAVLEKELLHDGNPVLKSHITNAYRHPTPWESISIRKATKDSDRKIDAAVAAVMAFGVRQEFLTSGKKRTGKVMVIR